jgi:hypothetical protein
MGYASGLGFLSKAILVLIFWHEKKIKIFGIKFPPATN